MDNLFYGNTVPFYEAGKRHRFYILRKMLCVFYEKTHPPPKQEKEWILELYRSLLTAAQPRSEFKQDINI
jgi:hypothetical protein